MSADKRTALCSHCNQPLRPNARFCSSCGRPCYSGNIPSVSPTNAKTGWRLIGCYLLLVVSIVYACFWRELYNWYVDLLKDYGSHLYWTDAAQIYDGLKAALIALGTFGVFHFEAKNRKMPAIISAILIFPCVLAAEIIYMRYTASTMGEIAAMLGIRTSVSPQIALMLVYSAILLGFVLLNDKLKKISFIFPILNIICFLLLKMPSILVVAASTLGLSKHWRLWFKRKGTT